MPEASLDKVFKEVKDLRKDVEELKVRVGEGFELSEWAKRRIEEYETSEKKVSHQRVKEKFSA